MIDLILGLMKGALTVLLVLLMSGVGAVILVFAIFYACKVYVEDWLDRRGYFDNR